MPKQPVFYRDDETITQELKEVADQKGCTLSAVLRQAVRFYLDQTTNNLNTGGSK